MDNIIKKQSVKIVSWNINGIWAILSKNSLQEYIQNHPDIDIILLQELKCQEDIFLSEEIQWLVRNLGFPHVYASCGEIKGYAGVAILSKIEALLCVKDIGHSSLNKEGRMLLLEFPKLFLFNVYQPCSGEKLKFMQDRLNWDARLKEILQEKMTQKQVLYMGDMNVAHENIDTHNPKNNDHHPSFTPEERSGFSELLKMGFYDTFRKINDKTAKYTFWNYWFNARKFNKGWRVDYALSCPKLWNNVLDSDIQTEVMGSDHCPLYIKLHSSIFE